MLPILNIDKKKDLTYNRIESTHEIITKYNMCTIHELTHILTHQAKIAYTSTNKHFAKIKKNMHLLNDFIAVGLIEDCCVIVGKWKRKVGKYGLGMKQQND